MTDQDIITAKETLDKTFADLPTMDKIVICQILSDIYIRLSQAEVNALMVKKMWEKIK
jgi:hypothetical protein